MNNSKRGLICVYIFVFGAIVIAGFIVNRGATAVSQNAPLRNRHCFIIDPGHGGVDGGAVSCTGVYESKINLDISIRLNDLLHLMGYDHIEDSDYVVMNAKEIELDKIIEI